MVKFEVKDIKFKPTSVAKRREIVDFLLTVVKKRELQSNKKIMPCEDIVKETIEKSEEMQVI
jgi:hypothetical protein